MRPGLAAQPNEPSFRIAFTAEPPIYGASRNAGLAAWAVPQIAQGGASRGFAGVAELVDALGLGPSGASRGGSSPSARTNLRAGRAPRGPLTFTGQPGDRDASHGNEFNWPQARAEGCRRTRRAQRALHLAHRRGQGSGPDQGVPQGQGPHLPYQEAVRPLADGGGGAASGR